MAQIVQHMEIDGPQVSVADSNNKDSFLGSILRRFLLLSYSHRSLFNLTPLLLHTVGRAAGCLLGPPPCRFQGEQLIVSSGSSTWLDRRRPSAMRPWRGMMYQHPLPRKTRAALQAITRIASGAVMEATAALAAEAGAAEVEAN